MQIENKTIDRILDDNKKYLDIHFEQYKNHVYRVFTLCQELDKSEENIEKYAIAAVFHDLGIWTDSTFDYLAPSIGQAKKYLIDQDKKQWVDEISLMIDLHHKRSKYKGPFERTVETFRRADWIDVTKGRMSFNLNKEIIQKTIVEYPILGFHKFLLLQTLKNFFKHPLNPLPMFKK